MEVFPTIREQDHAAHLVWNTLNLIYFAHEARYTEDKKLRDRLIEFGYRPKPRKATE